MAQVTQPNPIRVRILAALGEDPKAFLVDKLDETKPGVVTPCELLTLTEQEAKDLRASLDYALAEPAWNVCVYVVGRKGLVTVDRGREIKAVSGTRCKHDVAIRLDTTGAFVLCNCCGNSLRSIDLNLVSGCVPVLSGRCRTCFEAPLS